MKGLAKSLRWLTEAVHMGEGAYTFSLTEDGDVGLFLEGIEKSIGVGDSAEEALLDAHRKHREQFVKRLLAAVRATEQGET